MLNIIKKFDAGTIRALAIATVPLLVLIASLFGVDELMFEENVNLWVDRAAAIAAALAVAWAAWERLFKPTPPLTETAAKLTEERLVQEGKTVVDSSGNAIAGLQLRNERGHAKAAFLALLSAVALGATACGTLFPSLKSFDDRAAGAYTLVSSVADSANALLDVRQRELNQMEPSTAREEKLETIRRDFTNVHEQLERARTAIDVARSLQDIDFKSAENRLDSAVKILKALQEYLEKEGA
jgi:hypothetical protein